MRSIIIIQFCLSLLLLCCSRLTYSQMSFSPVHPDKNEVVFYKNVFFDLVDEVGLFHIQVSRDENFNKIIVDEIVNGSHFFIPILEMDQKYYWRVHYNDLWHGVYTFATSKVHISSDDIIEGVRILPTKMMDKQWIVIDNPLQQQLDIHVYDHQQQLILHHISDNALKSIEIQDWKSSDYTIKISSPTQALTANLMIASDVR
jgi:predicted DNA-binding ArsR family transcriptional regulator